MSHHVKRRRGREASLILVVGVPSGGHHSAVLHVVGGGGPAVVVVLGREEVVERDAHGDILHPQAGQAEVVAQVEVRGEVAVEHHTHVHGLVVVAQGLVVLKARVRHVLLADVLVHDAGLEAAVVEGQDAVHDPVGREGQRLVAEVGHGGVGQLHGDVLHAVSRPRGVDVPAQPVGGLHGGLKLHAQAVALGHVARDGLAYLVDLARQHELVLVVHPVEVGAGREHRALVLIAGLQVVQPLGLGHLQLGVDVVLEVVARRLLVGDGVGGVHLVVGRQVVVDAELGVEEVVRLLHLVDDALIDVPVDVVGGPVHLDADVAVLQVDEGVQARQQVVGQLAVDVEVGLPRVVVVVLVVGGKVVDGLLHPRHVAEVAAVVAVPAAAEGGLQAALVVVDERGHGAVEVVVHPLLAYQVALGPGLLVVQVVLEERALGLVLLIIAHALGVVQGGVEAQLAAHVLVPDELVVLLVVVVGLAVVVVAVAVGVPVFAARVVAAAVELLLVLAGVVPGVVGLLNAVPGDELHHGVVAEVSGLQQVAVQLRRGAVQVALRAEVRQAALQPPVPAHETRAEAHRLLVAVVGAAAEVDAHEGLGADVLGLHVQRGAEGTGAVGRRAHAALYLHRLHGGGEVAHVHPVELCALGVVHGHAVGRDVDARGVGAAHAQRRVADAVAGVAGHRHARRQRDEERDVLSVVHLGYLPFVHVSKGHGGLLRGAGRRHLHALQLHTLQRVYRLGGVHTGCPCECSHHPEILSHTLSFYL